MFEAGSSLTSTEAERVIASAIQLIRSSNVRDEVQATISQQAFDQITLFDVSSVSDTFFVRITVGSLDPAIARSAARAYAEEGARRLRIITIARSVALLAIMAIVAVVSPAETLPYIFTIILIFIATWSGIEHSGDDD